MLRRHHILSATMLALAATMSEEDSPVVPSPDDLDAPPEESAPTFKPGDYVGLVFEEQGSLTGMGGTIEGLLPEDGRGERWRVLCEDGISRAVLTEHLGHVAVSPDEHSRGIASIDAALSGGVPKGSLNFMIGGPGNGKGMFAAQQRYWVNGSPIERQFTLSGPRMTSVDRSGARDEQRANKKRRASRKAKKGWA